MLVVGCFPLQDSQGPLNMRTIHLLRKLNPAEWGGTESAMQRLFEGLGRRGVDAVAYCPRIEGASDDMPAMPANCEVRRFRAIVPVMGVSRQCRNRLISMGGNLMSFDLIPSLLRERPVSVIHTHALGRIGGIGLTIARYRRLPFVVSIHGGAFDLPNTIRRSLNEPARGFEWGKLFGWLLKSRQLFRDADAILTCNETEADFLREAYPQRRIIVQPHGVPLALYQTDQRQAAQAAFPAIRDRQVLLNVGRIDPVKNQDWLLERTPEILQRYPRALLVLAGACTDDVYGQAIKGKIQHLGLGNHVLLTGGLPSDDPRLIGLYQQARAVVLPSLSETFGLVILEAWAAGTPVLSSRTSGPSSLIAHGRNGWLFDLDQAQSFHQALSCTLGNPKRARDMAAQGTLVSRRHSLDAVADALKTLYEQVIQEKRCAA